MIPQVYPSTYVTDNGATQMVVFRLTSISGLQRWIDYIPVKFLTSENQESNSYNAEGCILVDTLSSASGKTAWIDYIPIYIDNSADDALEVSSTGYIPIGLSTVPSLVLDFAGTKTLDSRITFTRNSQATYFDADGVMQIAAVNEARFDHNPTTGESLGLLVEEQRSNLQTYSDDFANAAWTKTRSSITSNTIIAPDGTLTGDKLVEDTTASNTHNFSQSFSATSGTTYTASVFCKAAERTEFALQLQGAFTATQVRVNLSTGTVLNTSGTPVNSGIVSVGNGWYRVFVSQTATSTASSNIFGYISVGGTTVYTGDGYSGIYIWGAQLEAGAFPTSYIPTTAASATRNADAASMTGTNFSSWFRADEGTLYAEYQQTSSVAAVFAINDNTTSNRIQIGNTTSAASQIVINTNAASQMDTTNGTYVANNYAKVSGSYKLNDCALSANGTSPATDTGALIPVVSQAQIGARTSGAYLNGTIKKIAYYPKRLTNAELRSLTTV